MRRYTAGRFFEAMILLIAGLLSGLLPELWLVVGAVGAHFAWQLAILVPRPCAICGGWQSYPRLAKGWKRGYLPIGPGAVTWLCFVHAAALSLSRPLVEEPGQPPAQ